MIQRNLSIYSQVGSLIFLYSNQRTSQYLEYLLRTIEPDTRIGDALPIAERLSTIDSWSISLRSCEEMTLYHHTHDRTLTTRELRCDISRYEELIHMIFLAVRMRHIHHEIFLVSRFLEECARRHDSIILIVRTIRPTTQDDMCIFVTKGLTDGGMSIGIYREKCMPSTRAHHRIERYLERTIGSIFESDGHTESRCHLAM